MRGGRTRNQRTCGLVFRGWLGPCCRRRSATCRRHDLYRRRNAEPARSRRSCADHRRGARAFHCANCAEVTLEADPETIHADNAAAWKSAGINRISLGAQSFQDTELAAAGRMHRREDIGRAVEFLRNAGFENVSLDLIAGLPHQTPQSWRELARVHVCGCRPEHVSIYLLEIDDGSRLGSEVLAGAPLRRGGDSQRRRDGGILRTGWRGAGGRGLRALRNIQLGAAWDGSRHNLKYWRREPYFGFGAGAHSFDGQYALGERARYRGVCGGHRGGALADRAAAAGYFERGARRRDVSRAAAACGHRSRAHRKAVRRRSRIAHRGVARARIARARGPRVRLAPARLTVSNEVFVALLD